MILAFNMKIKMVRVRFVCEVVIDLWDILKMKKKIKRRLIEKDLFILEIKAELIREEQFILLVESRNLSLQLEVRIFLLS